MAILGLIFLWQFASQTSSRSFVRQWALLFLIAAMLTESLIRGPSMEGYCTTAWIFTFVANIPKLLALAVSSALVTAVTPRARHLWQKVLRQL